MSKRTFLSILIMMTACLLPFSMAIAQQSQVIHFQGLLTGPDGGPLPTDTYDITFSIWDQESGGVTPIWSELQVVEVNEGLFDVFLGNVNALSPDVFTYLQGDSELRYLQIRVSGDDPMSPRTQIGKTPNSFVSSRVLGDVQTGQGFIRMTVPPDDIHPVAEIMADDDDGITSFRMSTPPDPVMPAIEMTADAGANQSRIRMTTPPDPYAPVIEMTTDASAQSGNIRMALPPDDQTPAIDLFATSSDNITSFRMSIPPDDQTPVFNVELDGVNDRTRMRLGTPPDDIMPGIELSADGASNVYSFKLGTPPDDQTPEILMASDASTLTSSIRMTIPPDDQHPAFEVSADALLDRISMKLGLPPDDIMPAFEMTKQATGNLASFRMSIPPNDQLPAFDMTADGDNSITSFRLSTPPDDIMPAIEMTSNGITNESKIRMGVPPNDIMPAVEITTDITQMARIKLGVPPDDQTPVLEFVSDALSHAGSIKLAVPPDDQYPAIEIAVDQDNNKRLFKLATPPDDIMPAMEMVTGVNENSFRIASPVLGGMRDEITDPKFEVNVDSDGGSLDIYDEIGKYMGLEPTPFFDGGYLKMLDPLTENTMVSLGSDGHITAYNGTFGSGTNTGLYSLATGEDNIAAGNNSFAGGHMAEADHDNCFVWSDHPFGPSEQATQTSADNQFLVRATGGVAFYSNASLTSGVTLAPDASSWSAIVPPGPDLNTRPVDGEEILSKIEELPLRYYSHRSRGSAVEHIGPLPEDFNQLFTPGQEDRYISLQDEAGVALAAVKELIEIINDLKEENKRLERRIEELEKR